MSKMKTSQADKRNRKLARDLKILLDTISPYIEKHTAIVCPGCTDLCCKDKHARYDSDDILFMEALGSYVPQDHEGRMESDPCRNMTETGCALERWERPFRCTGFFCNPLLHSLESDVGIYRVFIQYLEELTEIRRRMREGADR